MGYVICHGTCCACGNVMGFNPLRVPSIRIDGVKQPVCATCMGWLNDNRVAKGLAPVAIAPDAYEAIPEEALPLD